MYKQAREFRVSLLPLFEREPDARGARDNFAALISTRVESLSSLFAPGVVKLPRAKGVSVPMKIHF